MARSGFYIGIVGLVLATSQAYGQSAETGTNLTPNAPASVTIYPDATEMISIPAPVTPSFTTDTSSTGAATNAGAPATSGAASGSTGTASNPFNADCGIPSSDDPANLSFDTTGCGN